VNVVLSCVRNPDFEALPDYLAAALRSLGHRVTLFDHRRRLLPGRLRRVFPGLETLDRERLNRAFVRTVQSSRADLVIVNQGMLLSPSTIRAVRASGVRCVNWFSDFPAEFEDGLRLAPAYDAIFLGSSFAAGRHREAGHRHAAWLPFGCDPRAHHPEDQGPTAPPRLPRPRPTGLPDGADVVFVGSHYPERQILLRFLRGLPVGVWGPGWERAADDPHVAPMIRGGALRPADWRRLYARCGVALNIHYGSFGPREVSGDLANTRVFEILACGAFQVVDRQGDILRLFKEGEHLAAYSSGEELRERVEEALRDEGLRRSVAARGRAEVLARHTYEHRALHLADPKCAGQDAAAAVARPVAGPAGVSAARGLDGTRARTGPR